MTPAYGPAKIKLLTKKLIKFSIFSPAENNNNVGGANIDDILDGISVGDLNEIDENALLGETDDEQQQEEDGEDEEEEEGDQRPAAQKSNSSLEQSPQNVCFFIFHFLLAIFIFFIQNLSGLAYIFRIFNAEYISNLSGFL